MGSTPTCQREAASLWLLTQPRAADQELIPCGTSGNRVSKGEPVPTNAPQPNRSEASRLPSASDASRFFCLVLVQKRLAHLSGYQNHPTDWNMRGRTSRRHLNHGLKRLAAFEGRFENLPQLPQDRLLIADASHLHNWGAEILSCCTMNFAVSLRLPQDGQLSQTLCSDAL